MSRPWMPLWIADYLADTAHLNAAQSGAYLHLIMHYWNHGGLPNDDRQLAQIARMTRGEWRKNRAVIAGFFVENWTHERIEIELKKAEEKYLKRAAAGHEGGIKSGEKRRKNKEISQAAVPTQVNNTEALLQANTKQTSKPIEPTTTTTTEEDRGRGEPTLPGWMRSPGYLIAKTVAELCSPSTKLEFEDTGWRGATQIVNAWLAHHRDVEHTGDQILASVRDQLGRKRDGPPSTITFFEKGLARHMERLRAISKSRPPSVQVSQNGKTPERNREGWQQRRDDFAAALDRFDPAKTEPAGAAGPVVVDADV